MDFNSRVGRTAPNMLTRESIVWLTMVDGGGCPQPRPVWLHRGGKDILIFSPPKGDKVCQIAENPHASVHFKADKSGTDVVVLLGEARRVGRVLREHRAAHLHKCRRNMKAPPSFQARFRVPIVTARRHCAATEQG